MSLKHRVAQRWAAMGLAARMWWTGIGAVGLAAVLVLVAAAVVDTSSHPAADASAASTNAGFGHRRDLGQRRIGLGRGVGFGVDIDGQHGDERGLCDVKFGTSILGASSSGSSGSSGPTAAAAPICANVKGTTVMGDGMVMAPVPSGPPTASQQAAANQLVAQTEATLTNYTSLSAATAAGYTPATNPNGYMVHYANWQIARTDGFDPTNPAFLMYANTVNGPKLMGAMYLGPAPCTPGPDIGGSLTQWHAHDNLCLSGGQVVGQTSSSGTCAVGVHNTNTYFMLHVWTEPSLAATHQFQPDLTRAELAPIIEGNA